MCKTLQIFIPIFAIILISLVDAAEKCIWARGVLRCNKDHNKHKNVEIRGYDRDGFSIFKVFDPDDLIGVTFTEDNGQFQLDGCSSDFDFFPGIANNPDPYIIIHHYCNSAVGETILLPEFYTFMPDSYDVGVIELDDPEAKMSTTTSIDERIWKLSTNRHH